jgi:hypothetical protein
MSDIDSDNNETHGRDAENDETEKLIFIPIID